MIATRFLEPHVRVKHGLERERQIANALKAFLPIEDASDTDDKIQKVDRWIAYPTGRRALQIKYRETGKDMLFEVYDTFYGWDSPKNKVGRDMLGIATEYAVLLNDCKTVVMIPTEIAKTVIHRMMSAAVQVWAHLKETTFHYRAHGLDLQLKEQLDPRDLRHKMVAYIPSAYFVAEASAKVYNVILPKEWRN